MPLEALEPALRVVVEDGGLVELEAGVPVDPVEVRPLGFAMPVLRSGAVVLVLLSLLRSGPRRAAVRRLTVEPVCALAPDAEAPLDPPDDPVAPDRRVRLAAAVVEEAVPLLPVVPAVLAAERRWPVVGRAIRLGVTPPLLLPAPDRGFVLLDDVPAGVGEVAAVGVSAFSSSSGLAAEALASSLSSPVPSGATTNSSSGSCSCASSGCSSSVLVLAAF